MHICRCSWAPGMCINICIRIYPGQVTIPWNFTSIFRCDMIPNLPFLCSFPFLASVNCIFCAASFELMKNLATLDPKMLQLEGLNEIIRHNFYTLPIPSLDEWVSSSQLFASFFLSFLGWRKSNFHWTKVGGRHPINHVGLKNFL